MEKLSSTKLVPGVKKTGDCWFTRRYSFFLTSFKGELEECGLTRLLSWAKSYRLWHLSWAHDRLSDLPKLTVTEAGFKLGLLNTDWVFPTRGGIIHGGEGWESYRGRGWVLTAWKRGPMRGQNGELVLSVLTEGKEELERGIFFFWLLIMYFIMCPLTLSSFPWIVVMV